MLQRCGLQFPASRLGLSDGLDISKYANKARYFPQFHNSVGWKCKWCLCAQYQFNCFQQKTNCNNIQEHPTREWFGSVCSFVFLYNKWHYRVELKSICPLTCLLFFSLYQLVDLLQPELAAPGADILAAWSQGNSAAGLQGV